MNRLITFAAAGLTLVAAPALAQQTAPAPAPETAAPAPGATAPAAGAAAPMAPMTVTSAQDFVVIGSSTNAFEIASGELALERAESEEVRAFGERMIQDHMAASEQLMAAAEQDGVMMPPADGEGVLTVSEQHQMMLDELSAAEGAAFDQAYATMHIQAHEEAIALHQGFAEGGEDGAVKTFAAETLPLLEEHLAMAQALPTS